MRTTVTLSPDSMALLQRYVESSQQYLGPRVTLSSAVEEALTLALPIMVERLPKDKETREQCLRRRAADIKSRIGADGIGDEHVLAFMREALKLQEDCHVLLLPAGRSKNMTEVDAYRECMQAALSAYSAGASKLNQGVATSLPPSTAPTRSPRTKV